MKQKLKDASKLQISANSQSWQDGLCIGSGCMAWRSGDTRTKWDKNNVAHLEQQYYCGLAGKP